MLTRRHLRVKVMQSLYALWRDEEPETSSTKKFLDKSMTDMYDLFLLDLSMLVELKNYAAEYLDKGRFKLLATEEDMNPNLKFVNNALIAKIEGSEEFNELLEKKKLYDWRRESGYVQHIWNDVRQLDYYADYTATRHTTFKEDKQFLITLFKEDIAPNEKIHDYLEDNKLTWLDDMPIVNTAIVKTLRKMKANSPFYLPRLFKNEEDREFAFNLFNRTIMYNADFEQEISDKTPNWDKDRLAEIDAILIKMAICEFLYFPTIPVKVSINEYLEIAKEYSTPKSSVFINGVLDKISKEYEKKGMLNKTGRGLR